MDESRLASVSHPVVQEMLERRDDVRAGRDLARRGTRLAVVVQGGGMRGAISGAALAGLEAMGFGSVFDEAWGESAGAINLAYFLAGQARFGSRIYVRDACTRRFIHPLRVWRVLDLDYLLDDVMCGSTPLDVEAVAASPTRFMVSATRFEDAAPTMHDAREAGHPLLELLRASAAAVPLATRHGELDGVAHVDGGLSNPIPIAAALESGATHVLALPTVPAGHRSKPLAPAARLAISPFLSSWTPALRRALFEERPRRYNAALDLLHGHVAAPEGVSIGVVPPPADAPRISRLTVDAKRMRGVMAAGLAQVHEIFGEPLDALRR